MGNMLVNVGTTVNMSYNEFSWTSLGHFHFLIRIFSKRSLCEQTIATIHSTAYVTQWLRFSVCNGLKN